MVVKDQGDGVFMFGRVEFVFMQCDEGIINKEDFIFIIIFLDGDFEQEMDNQNIFGVLVVLRDVFVLVAVFIFGFVCFWIWGYDFENIVVFINGVFFNELENGCVFWSVLGGLNDVICNWNVEVGLSLFFYVFGGVGGGFFIDICVFLQCEQICVMMFVINWGYCWCIMFMYFIGMMDNGWVFFFFGFYCWVQEGYELGSFYDVYVYFMVVDKKLGDKYLLNLIIFGVLMQCGWAGVSILEMYDLVDNNYYNFFWGY